MENKSTGGKRPILLLDIDGVLNVFQGRHAHIYEPETARYLLLDDRHRGWLAELDDVFDIVWGSMWQQSCGKFARIAGYPWRWPYLDFDKHYDAALRRLKTSARIGEGVGDYKDPAIRWVCQSERAIAWIDDDMTGRQRRFAERRNRTVPTLFLKPRPTHGMTRGHVDALLTFARENAPRTTTTEELSTV